MSLETEVWLVLLSIAAAVVPWAFSMHAKVSVIASSVEHLPELVEELHRTITVHEHRLDQHEKDIEAIKKTTSAGN